MHYTITTDRTDLHKTPQNMGKVNEVKECEQILLFKKNSGGIINGI